MPFATLTPREGAIHTPATPGGPWAFPLGGAWHPITAKDGQPRPFPVEVAEHAVSWFTDGSGESLVQMTVHEGELEYQMPSKPVEIKCEECGAELPVSELQAHIRACVLNAAKLSSATTVEELEKLTVDQLRKLAVERSVAVPSNAHKADLVAALAPKSH